MLAFRSAVREPDSHPAGRRRLDTLLRSYFRLDDDLDAVRDELSERDTRIAELVRKYCYLRVLRQPDPWECTVAYICSANSKIEGISRHVEQIAKEFGQQPAEIDATNATSSRPPG